MASRQIQSVVSSNDSIHVDKGNVFRRFWYIWVIAIISLVVASILLVKYRGGTSVLPAKSNSETIVVYGDTRNGHDVHRQVIERIAAVNPKLVFHSGDMVEDGTKQEQWNVFNEIVAPIRNVLYPALGNHELNAQEFYNNFSLPGNERWYSVQSNYIYFIVLDSTAGFSTDSEQTKWLKDELSEAKQTDKFIALVFHYAPFSSSEHSQDENVVKMQTELVPILEAADVDISFNGHDHIYERSYKDGVYYLTVGSSGAPLYAKESTNRYSQIFVADYSFAVITATKDDMAVNIYNPSGKELDSLDIQKQQ